MCGRAMLIRTIIIIIMTIIKVGNYTVGKRVPRGGGIRNGLGPSLVCFKVFMTLGTRMTVHSKGTAANFMERCKL